VFRIGGGELVLGVLDAPGASPRTAIFQRGELGALLKIGGDRGLVWVTSTRSGEPVAGAEVVIQQGSRVRHRAVTDKSGIAWLPGDNKLSVPYIAGADDPAYGQPLIAVVRSGKHVAIASERWQNGIETWQFGLPEVYYSGQDAIRGTVASERGMYRPGDRVHLLGVLRQRLANGKLAPPPGAVKVTVTDPDSNEVFSDDVQLTKFGTFRSELGIAKTARLGRYAIKVTKGATELRERFEVGEYRPVRFEVTLPASGSVETKKDAKNATVALPVSARYLYGAPVPNAAVSFTISGRTQREFGAWSEGFAFAGDGAESELISLTEGQTKLDAEGKAKIEIPVESLMADALSQSQAIELIVEASVRDGSGDVVAGRSVQSWARTSALVGLQSDAWVVDPKRGWTVKLLVAGSDGVAKPGKKVRMRLVRRKWVAVADGGKGASRYQGEWQDEEVTARFVTSGARATDVHFPLPAGGQYRLEAGIEGEGATTSEGVWAYGNDAYGAWENHARMAIHTDKSSYRPGERAKLYAEIPYTKATALLTLERQGVIEAKTLKVDGAGTPIEIDVTEREAPNVFASLAVIPIGLSTGVPAAGPPLRLGYRELTVSAEKRRLKVDVRPATARSKPGENVEVAVRVADAAGAPARAEVTLWAADEGVLKLTGYATPDPFVLASERLSHRVRTSTNLLRFASDVSDDYSEYGGDEAAGEDPGAAFRSRFLGTAFFSKGVVTDAKGEAKVTIPLPDNLTRWRVMAAVADEGDRFGSAEAALETAKPLMVEPALPRFLTRGDEIDATLMVHNQTGQRGTATVELSVTGAELRGKATQSVEVPSGGQARVAFPLRADRTGSVRVRAAVALGRERDAVQVDLPVHTPTLWQTELVGEGRLDQPRKLDVKIPATTEPGSAELMVSVAPGVLASISGSVDALIEYPHGCVEQTTSRLIPMVLLEELLRSSGDPRLSGGEHRQKMNQAVAHVLKHQNSDGGFGLWPSSESEGFLTAYALWGLLTAKDHGYVIPSGSVGRGLGYLKKHAADGGDMHGQFAPKETPPFAAFVLASAAQDDSGLGSRLAKESDELSRFGKGLLGAAFAERDRARSEPLLVQLSSARRRTASGALIGDEGDSSELFEYGRDLRATAAMVRALVLSGKGKDADDLILGILGERRKDGTWGTTYNNLWALHALVDYGMNMAQGASSGRVKLAVDSRDFATLDVSAKSRFKSTSVPADRLAAPGQAAQVSLSGPSGSSLRYTARLRWANTIASQAPVDRGFSVTRELLDAKSGKPVTSPTQGQLLRVRLSLTTKDDREQVALIDRLPAGFEAVDTALATSASDPRAGEDPAASGAFIWRELHDERVTHFADHLRAGTHRAEYLVRATRTGKFVRPAPSAEAMYEPDVFGHGAIETISVTR
jgi:alpha-2-macroglobulin